MSDNPLSVFINCPFDAKYKATFEALVFTVTASGYRVRCALEEQDGADIRFDKLCRLIAESDRTIHDLSRTELGPNDLPRFNMPFELGLAMGAKRFGARRQRRKTALIMVAEPYRLPAYLSDLGGNDLSAHHSDPRQAFASFATTCRAHRRANLCQVPNGSLRASNSSKPISQPSQRSSKLQHTKLMPTTTIVPICGVLLSS